MSTRHQLLQALADGACHSGTALGEKLGVTRAAIHKSVQGLEALGLRIERVSGQGYRLETRLVPLSATAIRRALAARHVELALGVVEETESTSLELLRERAGDARVVLAEMQTAGRGRRGRGWVATPFQNLILSMRWVAEGGPASLAGLSLAAGVALLRALEDFGVRAAGLKWPNDILLNGRKLAGLLVDLRGEANGPSTVVLGLGLNVHLAAADVAQIEQPCAMLSEALPAPIDRNELAAKVIAELDGMRRTFAVKGFEPFRAEWERHHLYHQQPVSVQQGEVALRGTVAGIDTHGNLLLRDDKGAVITCHAGEVSLRAAKDRHAAAV
jgi:BirA family biotin operon repressor/biotin-[acetyl-CoA-carboxylase] ligase